MRDRAQQWPVQSSHLAYLGAGIPIECAPVIFLPPAAMRTWAVTEYHAVSMDVRHYQEAASWTAQVANVPAGIVVLPDRTGGQIHIRGRVGPLLGGSALRFTRTVSITLEDDGGTSTWAVELIFTRPANPLGRPLFLGRMGGIEPEPLEVEAPVRIVPDRDFGVMGGMMPAALELDGHAAITPGLPARELGVMGGLAADALELGSG